MANYNFKKILLKFLTKFCLQVIYITLVTEVAVMVLEALRTKHNNCIST